MRRRSEWWRWQWWRCLVTCRLSSALSAEKNGGPPVTISKMSTPNDQKSAAASWPFLRITSGAMQNNVPFIEKVRRSSSTFATLKSVSRT